MENIVNFHNTIKLPWDVKVRKSRKQIMVSSILPKNELRIVVSAFRSFYGRIEDTINCFRELLTFSRLKSFRSKINLGIAKTTSEGKNLVLFCSALLRRALGRCENPGRGALCVEIGFTRTFSRNQDCNIEINV